MSDRFQHDQASSGTGESRSATSGPPRAGDDAETTDAVRVGATTSSHMSEAGAGGANRSGSGGSGGSAEATEDGSAGQSMDELLTGGDRTQEGDR